MPLSLYNTYFGGKPGAAAKARQHMQQTYGDKKGTSVFYATMNKKKNQRGGISTPKGKGMLSGNGGPSGV